MSSQHYGFEKLSLNCICWCWLKSRPTNIWLISDLTVDRTIKWNSLLWSEWFQNICSFDTLHLSSAMAFYSLLVWDLENLQKKKKENSLSWSNICLLSTCPVQSNMLAPEKKVTAFSLMTPFFSHSRGDDTNVLWASLKSFSTYLSNYQVHDRHSHITYISGIIPWVLFFRVLENYTTTCTLLFIAASFTRTKRWKQLTCPSTDE